jgi:hypothetical protein
MRRKGELSPNRVDRDWPPQIVLKANDCLGQNDTAIRAFCGCELRTAIQRVCAFA